MDVLCKLNKRCGCKDNACARGLARLERRKRDERRGRDKLLRKEAQREWPPGSCGTFNGRFFTVLGMGRTKDGWEATVSFDGNIVQWNALAMLNLNHA